MKVLIVGAGGVGAAIVRTAAARGVFESMVVADYDEQRARRAAEPAGDRCTGVRLNAADQEAVGELLAISGADVLVNTVDPRFVMPLFRAALACGGALPRHGHVAVAAHTPRIPTTRPG